MASRAPSLAEAPFIARSEPPGRRSRHHRATFPTGDCSRCHDVETLPWTSSCEPRSTVAFSSARSAHTASSQRTRRSSGSMRVTWTSGRATASTSPWQTGTAADIGHAVPWRQRQVDQSGAVEEVPTPTSGGLRGPTKAVAIPVVVSRVTHSGGEREPVAEEGDCGRALQPGAGSTNSRPRGWRRCRGLVTGRTAPPCNHDDASRPDGPVRPLGRPAILGRPTGTPPERFVKHQWLQAVRPSATTTAGEVTRALHRTSRCRPLTQGG